MSIHNWKPNHSHPAASRATLHVDDPLQAISSSAHIGTSSHICIDKSSLGRQYNQYYVGHLYFPKSLFLGPNLAWLRGEHHFIFMIPANRCSSSLCEQAGVKKTTNTTFCRSFATVWLSLTRSRNNGSILNVSFVNNIMNSQKRLVTSLWGYATNFKLYIKDIFPAIGHNGNSSHIFSDQTTCGGQ